jgi:hypothetical protein
MGCNNDGALSSSSVAGDSSAAYYQEMAYQAMFADSLAQAESYAYKSFMLSQDSVLECGALSLLCYIYYREGKQEDMQMLMQTVSPEVYMNVMDVQMHIEQQKAGRQQQYYLLIIILLLLLSGGVVVWYLHRMKTLRQLYQQRISQVRQVFEREKIELSESLTDNDVTTSMDGAEIAATRMGFDVLYAIINDQNISQMGKREEQALLKVLPMVDAALCTILSKASSPLTPKETFFCLMEYYGKNDHQKAQSFCCSDQAIRSTKSRLNKKLDISVLMDNHIMEEAATA